MGGCGCASYAQKGPSRRAGHLARRSQSRSHAPRSGFCFFNSDPIRRITPRLLRYSIPIPGACSLSLSPALFQARTSPHLRHSSHHAFIMCPESCPRHSPLMCTFDFVGILCFDGGREKILSAIKAYAAKATRIVCEVYDGFGKFGCGGIGVWAIRHRATI